jgi:hypothetical protein
MSQEAFLAEVADKLNAAGVPFMVTGSHGSGYHGQPRATNDLDLVIDPTAAQLDTFVASLGDDYYVSADAAREALSRRSMFNIINLKLGWKVDLIIRKNRPFSIEEFGRRQAGSIQGCQVPIVSPEDVILSKLEWDLITASDRQIRDALQVAMAKWTVLDQAYLHKWAPALGVLDKLNMLLQKAEQVQSFSQGGN